MRSALRIFTYMSFCLFLPANFLLAAELSREDQVRIIQDYLYLTGRGTELSPTTALAVSEEGESILPHKCGMSIAADFAMNRGNFDRDLVAALGADLFPRADLPLSYLSPSGRFKIHYAMSGEHAVYRAGEDSDDDGVPNYVESVAIIADSVWVHEVEVLGYPAPPSDSFYTSESDSAAYDIFLPNLADNFYGLAYPDSIWSVSPGHFIGTSFIELDNDYSSLDGYEDRPLDAVRVTMAHEFFHAIQFGIDPYEAEDFSGNARRYWMELSAVWMEEEVYDAINDYYVYLPYFFRDVTISLQEFKGGESALHPYSCGIFAMYLSQTYGRDIIRDAWLKCGEYGLGPHALIAIDDVVDSASSGEENLGSAFAEFAQWNYFTGFRAQFAPNMNTYEEAIDYPLIPNAFLNRNSNFQIPVSNIGTVLPEHLGAAYFRFEGGLGVKYQLFAADTVRVDSLRLKADTICNLVILDSLFDDSVTQRYRGTTELSVDWAMTACPSLEYRPDTCAIRTGCSSYTRAVFDSLFNVPILLDSLASPWYITAIYQLAEMPDSHEVETFAVPAPTLTNIVAQTPNSERYCSYLIIATPATIDFSQYRNGTPRPVKYLVNEIPDPAYRANCFGEISEVVEKPSELIAFPNPAASAEMNREEVRFRFRLQASLGIQQLCSSPFMTVDLFTVAGERTATIEGEVGMVSMDIDHQETRNEPYWTMVNQAGARVASGVYIAVARLYCDSSRKTLVAENKAKVALIR